MSLLRARFSTSAIGMFIWALVSSLGVASRASAQLVLHVNTSNETFWFTGSDTGTRDTTFGFPEVEWITSSQGSGPATSHDLSAAFTGVPTFAGSPTLAEGPAGFDISFSVFSFTPFTITGSGTTFDYSSYTTCAKSVLTSASTIPLNFGGGFHDITVSQSAIPEPSTYVMVCGTGALVGAVIFRRRKKPLVLTAS